MCEIKFELIKVVKFGVMVWDPDHQNIKIKIKIPSKARQMTLKG